MSNFNPKEYYDKLITIDDTEDDESIIGKQSDFWMDKQALATNYN